MKATTADNLIGSVAPHARDPGRYPPSWGIENGLHRCLDVAFREDACAAHLRQAAANPGVMRNVLNLF